MSKFYFAIKTALVRVYILLAAIEINLELFCVSDCLSLNPLQVIGDCENTFL